MDLKKPKFSKTEVSQKLNLKKLLGVDFKNHSDLKHQIAQELIDTIIERTESGKDVRGVGLKKYSDSYKNSDTFKDFGKTGKVNMTLSGGMLDDIDVLNHTRNTVKLGFSDETETKKAFRHNTGDKAPKREFFGVTKKDIRNIKKTFGDELNEIKKEEKAKQNGKRYVLRLSRPTKGTWKTYTPKYTGVRGKNDHPENSAPRRLLRSGALHST